MPPRVVNLVDPEERPMSDSLERARGARASLRSAMGDVESALAAPGPGREEAWRGELGESLTALSDSLEWHISGTEGEDGLLAEILTTAPRLAHKIDQAHADHGRLRDAITQATADIETHAEIGVLRDEVVHL